MSKRTLTVEESLMWMKQGKGDSLPNIEGNVLKTSTKYIAGKSVDIEANRLIVEGTVKKIGTTNFPKGNMLDLGTNYLVTGIRLLHDTTVGATTLTAVWKNEAPANWKNGELSISQGGSGNLFESPISDIANNKAATSNDDDFRDVIPFTIRGGSPFEIKAVLASPAVADQAYRLELRVIEIVSTTKN